MIVYGASIACRRVYTGFLTWGSGAYKTVQLVIRGYKVDALSRRLITPYTRWQTSGGYPLVIQHDKAVSNCIL